MGESLTVLASSRKLLAVNRIVRTASSLLLLFVSSFAVRAQMIPGVEWQRTFGGTNADNLTGLLQTADGGCTLIGTSFSGATGNKTSTNSGDYDGWLIKLDAAGNRVWEQDIGG